MSRLGDLAAQDGYDPNAFDVPLEQGTNVGWANRLGEILTTRPTYNDQTVVARTASPLVNITEGDIGRATEAAMGVSGGGMKVETPRGIRAYHSSPHDFDKFDLAKIGTGEGAQAYGHGLYFAENPAVSGQGGQYWKAFSERFKEGPESKAVQYLKTEGMDRAAAARAIEEEIEATRQSIARGENYLSADSNAKYLRDMDHARALLQSDKPVGPRTYEVSINADPAHMLDWDKPLREQGATEQLKRLHEATNQWGHSPLSNVDPLKGTGQDVYRSMTQWSRTKPQASADLQEIGIPGIKYLDEGSRVTNPDALRIMDAQGSREAARAVAEARLKSASMGDLRYWENIVKQLQPESSNYVIWDPNIIRIDKKYAIPGAAAGMGALATQDNYQRE